MRKFGIFFSISIFSFLFLFLFLFYGPSSYFRERFITTAMTTKSHQYLAKIFFDDAYISKVMHQNKVIEVSEVTDLDAISIERKASSLFRENKIYGKGYSGYLIEIFDPTRVHLAVSSKLGREGETSLEIAKRDHIKVVMNAVGFYDPEWSSDGAIPHGRVLQNGKIISTYGTSNVGGGFVGFTKSGKLFLGKVSVDELSSKRVMDAVEFGPFLIVNGKTSSVLGDGGWGVAPRSAIGQRKDGTVLFLVINGRIPSSVGVSMKELIAIMKKYGAYNAANMDGGASSSLIINQKIINKPVGGGENGLRKLPVFWVLE